MKDTVEPRPEGPEAKLLYGPGGYQMLKPGTYVVCSVTGRPIPLEQLRYWNVDKQEAYFDAAAAFRRHSETQAKK
ncbi:MAG: DUF2093 domain-containing protein [Alphaproteobacteria bacterium]|nr:DUF2093 domain-containing protein [Alphaproteobacteria bacterium]